ncbi:nicotinamide-nucleotide adenylyltransferase, NadR type [Parapedobacter composti]|uniref:Nicotinamide-nucleotide adenylyltransferase, NadR type n=1 Tax=Parapedobacter composti TaxID=623281 RepID=A0A1I1I961_9SPHI|nr:ATP-binding protein [Parapedobacter composti]SFC32282.1 nicotinamide-nucleotide adenylyltransferase, NadR type [Parapedobacter composti]
MDSTPLIKIAVVGPESTGKSVTAEYLAKYFGTVCVPEYAREYCRHLHREYTMQDELNMFYGQLALERSLLPFARHNLLICDTMFLTIKVWCDHLFGYTPDVVLDELQMNRYDGYLLMDIDLPWVDDPLRDFPHLREHFMRVWHNELQAIGANYVVVSGVGQERVTHALEAVQTLFNQ